MIVFLLLIVLATENYSTKIGTMHNIVVGIVMRGRILG